MKRIVLGLLLIIALSPINNVFSQTEYIQTTMDNNRYEMIHLVYGVHVYNLKFDKWTGNLWNYDKNGTSVAMRDPQDETDLQRKQCVYQLMKGYRDVVEHCFVLNTETGVVWEVTFKNGVIKYEKK